MTDLADERSGEASALVPPADERILAERYLLHMQRGTQALDDLAALFAPDAVYVEPFSGTGPHLGREAIRAYLASSLTDRPPDLALTIERLDLSPGRAETLWRCDSPAFVSPLRGQDLLQCDQGQITRLETVILEPPVFAVPGRSTDPGPDS